MLKYQTSSKNMNINVDPLCPTSSWMKTNETEK